MDSVSSMRPVVTCPYCGRRGRIQRKVGKKPVVDHTCPGPFILRTVENDQDYNAGIRLTVFHGNRPLPVNWNFRWRWSEDGS